MQHALLGIDLRFCAGLGAGLLLGAAVALGWARRRRAAPVQEPAALHESAASTGLPPQLRHEMRTLVSSVVGMADMLIEMPLGRDPHRWVGLLRQSSQHLLDLVEAADGAAATQSKSVQPAPPGNAPVVAPPAREPPQPRRKRVLVVEDNAVNQLVVLGYLKNFPVEVTAVLNGQQALDELASRGFDLVLMDCSMPVMDGFEATRRIRAREKGAAERLPIVAVTANATLEDEAQCRAVGMDDYVTKPLQRETMTRVLQEWLN